MQSTIKKGSLYALMLFTISNNAYATENLEARINALQHQVEVLAHELKAMQQQRGEQEKNIEQLTQELSDGNPGKLERIDSNERKGSTSSVNHVLASFKNGIVFQDESGNWNLAVNGRIQADYRHFWPDADAADTFSLRRARLGSTLTLYNDYSARIEGEYSGSSTTLTYGYVDINKFKSARLRAGQFKPFYGLERSMSSNFLDFQERSMADALLGSTYDRGVMIFGSPITGVSYSLAYINGTGTTDENDVKTDSQDMTGRLTANLAELAHWNNAVLHVGGFYAEGTEGSGGQASFIPAVQTEGRGLQYFRTTCAASACGTSTANAFDEDVERMRGGYEIAMAYGSVKLQGEYITTRFEGSDFERDMHAWYASAMWNITGEKFSEMYKDGVFNRLRPRNNYGVNNWGAFQLGVRYSRMDGTDFKSSNAAGTGVLLNTPTNTNDGLLIAANGADAWTVGLNWILTPHVRVVANYVNTRFDNPVLVRVNGKNERLDQEEALTMRTQFDF